MQQFVGASCPVLNLCSYIQTWEFVSFALLVYCMTLWCDCGDWHHPFLDQSLLSLTQHHQTASFIKRLWLCHGIPVSEPEALCKGFYRLQLETGRSTGPVMLFRGPQLRVAGAGTCSDFGLPHRARKHCGRVASQGEYAGRSGTQPESCAWFCWKLGCFW